MNWKLIRWLLVTVCATALFLAVFERRNDSAPGRSAGPASLLHLRPDGVNSLSLATPGYGAELERTADGWFLTRPLQCRADAGRVSRLLEALVSAGRKETITPEQRRARGLTLASYGLEAPRVRCGVATGGKRHTVDFGLDAPLGDLVYARVDESPEVVATARGVLAAVPPALDELRDRALLRGDIRQVSRVEIKGAGGFVQLARTGPEWRLQQPIVARADSRRVEDVLGTLYALRVESFVSDAHADPVAYGLTPEDVSLQVSVWLRSEGPPRSVLVGKAVPDAPGRLYAMVAGSDSVLAVSTDVVAVLAVRVSDLRDRRVCPLNPGEIASVAIREGETRLLMVRRPETGWVIEEPLECQADDYVVSEFVRRVTLLQAAEFVDGATNAAALGLGEPACRVALSETAAAPAAATNRAAAGPAGGVASETALRIGRPEGAAELVPVLRESDGAAFRVAARDVLALGSRTGETRAWRCADPLTYRNRQVLRLNADRVRRITRWHLGAEETVARDASGTWVVEMPPQATVSEPAVADLLTALANLRALRLEPAEPSGPSRYGFDAPDTRLTVGLTGDGGIQKTLLLGSAAGTDGVYAAVQGQDVVFVLSRATAARLARSLAVWPAAP